MCNLRKPLWSTTTTIMDIEATKLSVEEQIRAKDDELNQLKYLLNDVINERNEARKNYQSLLVDKLFLQKQLDHHHHNHRETTTPPLYSGVSTIEDEPITNYGFSSSDCEESIVSSPPLEIPFPAPEIVIPTKGLPENGKFLEAVMKAGPLLQNLLLVGPLPQWHHPPPQLDTYQIPPPPLVIPPLPRVNHLVRQQSLTRSMIIIGNSCGEFNNQREFSEDCDSSTKTKYQRISF
uniref:uncharacterized protein LOC122605977 n=1 Tax=Erigeron canadensis TaxID=72917 RepID=UPI001CB88AE8|nr:uncharacterized protein LOC122605977 [Erigeron canadensis]